MKRIISLALICIFMLSAFAACKDGTGDGSSVTTSEPVNTGEVAGESAPAGNEETAAETAETGENVSEGQVLSEVYADIAEVIEFPPAMEEITDRSVIETMYGINFDDCEEVFVTMSPVSVHLYEVILIKPKADKKDAITATLEARRTTLIEDAAFYPSQITTAENSVVGSGSDLVYLIVHENAAEGAAVVK